jgi:hypothetical protein
MSTHCKFLLEPRMFIPYEGVFKLIYLFRVQAHKKVMNGYHYNKYEIAAFVIASIMIVAGGILGLSALL